MKFTSVFLLTLLPILQAPNTLATIRVSPSEGNSSLTKRDCWFGKPVGCTFGFCFKTCGNKDDGSWCYTATDKGSCTGCGNFHTCTVDSDCNSEMACSADDPTSTEHCDVCGCSCH